MRLTSTATHAASSVRTSTLRAITWPHPEWWTAGLSALAWLVLLAQANPSLAYLVGGPPHHSHLSIGAGPFSGQTSAIVATMIDWLVMVAAMMFPLVLSSVRTVAGRSLWHRRDRAIAGFLIGYSCPWIVAGLIGSVILTHVNVDSWIPLPALATAAFLIAAAWQVSPIRDRALRSCHRAPVLALDGWAADRDTFRHGGVIARGCLLSCWPSMTACALAGHGLLPMALVAIVGWSERYAIRPDRALAASLLVWLGFLCSAGAFFYDKGALDSLLIRA